MKLLILIFKFMIKKTVCLLTIVSLVLITSCKKEDATSKINEANLEVIKKDITDTKYPTMRFEKIEHDFGVINEGDKVETVFKFKNEGTSELLIINAEGSCGCTIPEYPKTPVKPGEVGEMKVSFDSNGKPGQQQKSVTVTTNTATGTEKINIKATVTPKTGK